MLDLFSITKRIEIVFYKLELSITMRIYNVFHASLLRKASNNSLSSQVQKSSDKIVIEKENEKWELADIRNSRWHYDQLQYQCQWDKEKERDYNWYNTSDDEFDNAKKIMIDYHKRYLNKIDEINNLTSKDDDKQQSKRKRRQKQF